MEKNMETIIMGLYRVMLGKLGTYLDSGQENGSYHNGAMYRVRGLGLEAVASTLTSIKPEGFLPGQPDYLISLPQAAQVS